MKILVVHDLMNFHELIGVLVVYTSMSDVDVDTLQTDVMNFILDT